MGELVLLAGKYSKSLTEIFFGNLLLTLGTAL